MATFRKIWFVLFHQHDFNVQQGNASGVKWTEVLGPVAKAWSAVSQAASQ